MGSFDQNCIVQREWSGTDAEPAPYLITGVWAGRHSPILLFPGFMGLLNWNRVWAMFGQPTRYIFLMAAVTLAVLVAPAIGYSQEYEGSNDIASAEAVARKQRSIAILEREGVPYIDHLPLVPTGARFDQRDTEDVALRAIALAIVAVKGESLDQRLTEQLISRFDIWSALSPKERSFVVNPTPSDQERFDAAWRYECYWVLLWALGFEQELGRPDHTMDPGKGVEHLRRLGREGFLAKARMRSKGEILDALDLIYRYHWAVVQARLNDQPPPAGLNSDVVYEWHYVLNWLVGYEGAEWDDVRTDT